MAKTISEVAAEVRVNVLLRRYPAKALPSERTIASQSECSRTTVRLALEVLRSEGIIVNVPGGRWQITNADREATFASFAGFIEVVPRELRPGRVQHLLEFRRREFTSAVDSRMAKGNAVTDEARAALNSLRPLGRAGSVLEAEDELMTQLMLGSENLLEVFAAHELRRALAKVRALIDLDFGLYPNVPGFMALIDAWDKGDRAKTLLCADRVASEREALYVRLMRNAAGLVGRDATEAAPG